MFTFLAHAQTRQVLPDTVVPAHYDLEISPDLKALTFHGTVRITIDARIATQDIVLNAEGLSLYRATLDNDTIPNRISFDDEMGRATLHFNSPIASGSHELSISYQGKIGRTTDGFFAMDYDTPEGPRRTLGTNLEPAGARQLLPCWDEPGRKATFSITVDAPTDRLVISNMPVAEVTPISENTRRVRFATSPKMSTYLLFLSIGDFERIHKEVEGVDVGVVVKRGDTAKATYALEETVRLLSFFNDYFDVPYPLPKLDLIAAPGRINGSAMENWGAIFYSQDYILFDPDHGTELDRQDVFRVVAHEVAHQWFGDLVTMQWWDDLWLNEGFARWMQTFVTDALHPDWEIGLQAQSIYERGKKADALPSTHPVLQEIRTVAQASQAFDNITYDKGAAIIHMLSAYMGQDNFREGLRRYMRAHSYGNTKDTDLWSVMEEVDGKPILEIERDFTRQEGLPLVHVTGDANSSHITHGRFVANPTDSIPRQHWTLPLSIADTEGTQSTILLSEELQIPKLVIVNAGQTAYTRVLYSESVFEGLLPFVSTLNPADQLGFLNDGLALGLAGYAPTSRVLDIAQRLPIDANPIVWGTAVDAMTYIDLHYRDTPGRALFRKFACEILRPLAVHLGDVAKEGELPYTAILRSNLSIALGTFEDLQTIESARELVRKGDGTAELRRAALQITAANADEATFDLILSRTRKTMDPLEKYRMYLALSWVKDPSLAQRMIAIALSNEVPAGSHYRILLPLLENHPDLAWDQVVPNLNDSEAAFDKVTQWRIVILLAGYSSAAERPGQLRSYIEQNVPYDARKPFEGAFANIQQNQRVEKEVLPEINQWIAEHLLAKKESTE